MDNPATPTPKRTEITVKKFNELQAENEALKAKLTAANAEIALLKSKALTASTNAIAGSLPSANTTETRTSARATGKNTRPTFAKTKLHK